MTLTDIRLQNYRSYTDASFELGPGVNIVVGPNAAGKTNLLEGIMVSCVGKSYRAKDALLLNTDQQWARLDVHTADNSLRTVKFQHDTAGRLQKTYEIDAKVHTRLPLHLIQPVVLFEPNNLQLIENEPSLRRAYFDDLIEQYAPAYEKYRAHYKRALTQRNALLKQGRKAADQLFVWNLRLVELGEQLVTQRKRLLEAINSQIAETYQAVAGHDKTVSIHYDTSIGGKDYATGLMKKLEDGLERDLLRGFTGHGPHRDDFTVLFGDAPALQSASRGEIRTLLLALKIIELKVLEKERGVRPLLLLDDVFSELDGARRRSLTSFLKDYQTVITTTDADSVIENFSDNYTIIAIN